MKLGVDIGGSNLRVAAIDEGGPEPIREPIQSIRDPDNLAARIAMHCHGLAANAPGPHTVGVGLAAMLADRQGHVANAPNLGWRDVAFGKRLKRALGPAYQLGIYNDVNAIAWAEATHGAARGARDALVVFVGTGIGAGIIANGALVEGATNCAGEIGHFKVSREPDAAPCGCGAYGCVEAYAGGAALIRQLQQGLREGRAPTLASLATVAELHPGHAELAIAQGDAWTLALWQANAEYLAWALASGLALLNCDTLVLGGGVLSKTPTLYVLTLAALPRFAPAPSLARVRIALAQLGDDAGIRGAAELAANGISLV